MATYQEWKQEQDHQRRLKQAVDSLGREIIEQKVTSEPELAARLEETRRLCQELFPDRLDLFDLIYRSRLQRLWEQFGRGK